MRAVQRPSGVAARVKLLRSRECAECHEHFDLDQWFLRLVLSARTIRNNVADAAGPIVGGDFCRPECAMEFVRRLCARLQQKLV